MSAAPHFKIFAKDHVTVTLLHPVTTSTLSIEKGVSNY